MEGPDDECTIVVSKEEYEWLWQLIQGEPDPTPRLLEAALATQGCASLTLGSHNQPLWGMFRRAVPTQWLRFDSPELS